MACHRRSGALSTGAPEPPLDNHRMHRITLERQQVWVYLAAIGLGLGTGSAWPDLAPWLEALLWPTLMLLLYATRVGSAGEREGWHTQRTSACFGRIRALIDTSRWDFAIGGGRFLDGRP